MEDAHRPLSYSPYAQPIPDNLVTQPAIYYPARPWSQQQQSTQEPLLSMPRPNDQLQSNDQPSMICGFTLTELASVAIQVAGVTIAAVFGAWAIKAYGSANVANQLSADSLSQSNIANRLAQDALKQSLYANVLAIINLCLSDQYRDSAVCPAILDEARFSSVVRGVIPTLSIVSTTTQRIPISTSSLSVTITTTRTAAPSPSLPVTLTTTRTAAATTQRTTLADMPTTIPHSDSGSGSGSGNHQLPFGAIVGIIIGVVLVVAIICLALIRYRRRRSRL